MESKVFVLTYIVVKNGGLKKAETFVSDNFQTLHDFMYADFGTLFDQYKAEEDTKFTYNSFSSNIDMFVNTPDSLIHYSWNINTKHIIKD
jgi:hypothetical protein